MTAPEDAWMTWTEVLTHEFKNTPDAFGIVVALRLLQPHIDRPRFGEPRVPRWVFDLVTGLLCAGVADEAEAVVRWCAAGDAAERSAAVLSCFDLDANRQRLRELVGGEVAS